MKLSSHNHAFLHSHNFNLHEALPAVNRTLRDIPSLIVRSASTSTSTCTSSDDTGTCQKPTVTSGTLTIALAAAIPTVSALVVLFFLHRRIRRRQAVEDANDKHKSLDFGLGAVSSGNGGARNPKLPEMTVTDMEKSTNNIMRGRGLSMDMNSPFLLPAAVQNSRESFHSMSRTVSDAEDPYRPVTFVNDNDSVYSSATRGMKKDNASVITRSTDRSNDRHNPFSNENAVSPDSYKSQDFTGRQPPPPPAARRGSVQSKPLPPTNRQSRSMAPPPNRQPTSGPGSVPVAHESRTNGDHGLGLQYGAQDQAFQVTPPSPPGHDEPQLSSQRYPVTDAPALGETTQLAVDRRVSVMGLRPLPPDDPTDNPEQRANRIRSFYKEYFDDSKPNPPGQYPEVNPYESVYEQDYYDYADGAMYDPDTGDFISAPAAPFAQGMGRRAMTPDARGPGLPYGRVRSNTSHQSTGHINNRAFQKGPMPPKKKVPPPTALTSLPTPHMLKDDMMLSPISFAPKVTYRDQRLGRGADSPTGTSRPYSPAVQIHSPLVRSFDDLMVIPAAHELRKSGNFTALDFAPPPRFRNETGSVGDAGSIRSNRSGISAMQRDAVRAGAYRVSRIPKEMVGSKDDFSVQLKPTWDMRK